MGTSYSQNYTLSDPKNTREMPHIKYCIGLVPCPLIEIIECRLTIHLGPILDGFVVP